MTALDPRISLANLVYIGYGGDPASALHITRRRSVDRKKQRSERNVLQCFVFGPKSAGKSSLLNLLLGRCCISTNYCNQCSFISKQNSSYVHFIFSYSLC